MNADEIPLLTDKVSPPAALERSPTTEPLWTVDEVASYFRLEPQTVRAMARRGELPAIKIGRQWRFKAADIKK